MSTNQDKLLSAIESLNPPGGPWGLTGLFDQIEIGESTIAEARRRYPEHDVALWNAFKLLMPNGFLREAPDPVYRAHCHELLDRVRRDLDTTLGTKAEVMMGLAKASLVHPLSHDGTVLYAQLFQEILPNTPVAAEIAQLTTMAYSSETERELADLAQKCKVVGRKPKKESEWRTPPAL